MKRSVFGILALPLLAIGCGGKLGAPTSTVTGTVATESFPSTATEIVATSGRGVVVHASFDARGAFSVPVAKGDTYAFAVVVAGRRVPLVMPRRSGKLSQAFKVSSDGVVIALGRVHYLPAGPKAPIRVGSGSRCDGECVQDDGASTCSDGSQAGGDGENGTECENGVDVATHAACVDGDVGATDDVDGGSEMAVPERAAPSDASGCDDKQEQDGER